MQQPPEADRAGENQQSEDLVAPEGAHLPLAPLFLSNRWSYGLMRVSTMEQRSHLFCL